MKTSLGENTTPVGARLRAPTGVIVFQVGGPGAEPPAAGGIFLPSLKDKVQLFLSASRFREARARALALPASSMSQTSLGSLSKALRRSRMGSRKAFMDSTRSFLQSSATSDSCVNVKKQRGRMLWRPKGLSPFGNLAWGKHDACWRAASRANRRHCFPGRGPGAEPPAAGGIFLPSKR